MSLNKRIKGDFTLESVSGLDTVILKSQQIRIQGLDRYIDDPDNDGVTNFVNTVTIDGNLIVSGNTTTIETTNTSIVDTFIVLNSGETGDGVSLGTNQFNDGIVVSSGFKIDRGTADAVGIRYNDDGAGPGNWEATDDGIQWYSLDTQVGTFELIDDLTPQLGGNLDVNSKQILSVNNGDIVIAANYDNVSTYGEVKVSPVITLDELDAIAVNPPAATANENKIYAKTPGPGGTGIYVTNDTVTDEELISKSKALVFSIIF